MHNYHMTIGGKPKTCSLSLNVINPATGQAFATCSMADESIVDEAVKSARSAFTHWSNLPDQERGELLLKLAAELERNMPEMMELVTKETGKPLNGLNGVGAGMEVGAAIAWIQATAAITLPIDVIQDDATACVEVHRKPLGVVASITPWNWPLMIAIWHVIPALKSGNTVVIKPSPLTPISTLRFVEIAQRVLPSGVLNAVVGDQNVGQALTQHASVNKVIFTGSTGTGKAIMRNAADNLQRLTLELGGNDAGIVLPNTAIEKIADKLFSACFHNNGQTCACLKRLYVHESQYEELSKAMATRAKQVLVGDGLKEGIELGPLQNKMQFEKVKELVEDAKRNGAIVLAGGKAIPGPGYFYQPTVIGNIKDGTRLVDEEQFGPAIPIITYQDVSEVIARANNNDCGLGASIWSSDIEFAKSLAGHIEAGTVWINDHGAVQPDAPFGGVKQSGFGVEFGTYGLEEYVSLQTIKVCK